MPESPPVAALERRALKDLFPSKRNPRRHDAVQVDKLKRSLSRFGWTRPLLIRPDGEIVVGEAVWRAARELKLADAPVLVLDRLTAREADAYRIADNRLALDATWDDAQLGALMQELAAADFDLPAIGFSDAELTALLNEAAPAEDAAADQAVPPPASPVTRLGDIWRLGPHRLICGDSTDGATFASLFAEDRAANLIVTDPPYGMSYEGGRAKKRRVSSFTPSNEAAKMNMPAADVVATAPPAAADLVFTDPPYGMSFGAGKEAGSTAKGALVKAHGMILGDDAQGDDLVKLVAAALTNAVAYARPEASAYVCFTWRTWAEFERAMLAAGLDISSCIVWDKGSIGLGFAHYRPRHEFIFYRAGKRWYGGKTEGDVWTLTRGATGEYVHPTQKPVELIERALKNSSRRGDIVLDPFGGSGSTLIACERLNRRARLIELDPKYCDAIARRWEKFTGRTAERAQG